MLKLGLPVRKKKPKTLFYNFWTLKFKVLSTDNKKQKVPHTTPKLQVMLYLGTLPSTRVLGDSLSDRSEEVFQRVYGGASIYRSFC